MKIALCVTDQASKAFQIQQVMGALGYKTFAVCGIDTLFGCIESMEIDIILVSELMSSRLSAFSIIKAIREYEGSPQALAVIHLWSRLEQTESWAMGGPITTVVALTLESAKNALGLLQAQ
jgi:DNA-binding response OmpR family regulator